jgi:hypothetical protein
MPKANAQQTANSTKNRYLIQKSFLQETPRQFIERCRKHNEHISEGFLNELYTTAKKLNEADVNYNRSIDNSFTWRAVNVVKKVLCCGRGLRRRTIPQQDLITKYSKLKKTTKAFSLLKRYEVSLHCHTYLPVTVSQRMEKEEVVRTGNAGLVQKHSRGRRNGSSQDRRKTI